MSFLDWNGYGEKKMVGFQNYIDIFTKDTTFWSSLGNTVRIGIIGFPIAILLGLVFAALICNLKRFRTLLQTVNSPDGEFFTIYHDTGSNRDDLYLYL